ncbi:MAG TPA: adenylate/guanylate cyclase domain-containing protein [Candidatus Binataceae bacterium]|nr:adenylate/guanylate cyclase domain-containing protein [Candidatus Binataceae bacterium]
MWKTVALGAAVVVILFSIDAFYPTPLAKADLQLFDLRLRALRHPKPLDLVAIVAIDDKSLKDLGEWPWPRSVMGQLVDALTNYKVKAIGFDVAFSEPDAFDLQRADMIERLKAGGISEDQSRALVGPRNDRLFADALRAQGNTIMGFPFESHSLTRTNERYSHAGFAKTIEPPPPIEYGLVRGSSSTPRVPTATGYLPNIQIIRDAARGSAYFDINSDPDSVIRTQMLVIGFDGHYYLPLPVAMVALYRGSPLTSLQLDDDGVARLAIGNENVPVDELGQMLINFRGPTNTFSNYSASDVIAHRVPADKLAGKLVLVGVTGHGLGDRVSTPLDGNSPGVAVTANVIDNLIAGDFIRRSIYAETVARILGCFLGLAVTFAVAFMSEKRSAIAAASLAVGYLVFSHLIFVYNGLALNLIFPLLMLGITYTELAAYRYATEGTEKRHLKHAFEHYLHPKVIESMLDKPDTVKLGGELRHLSVLFADIVNYTARAERERPEDLVALLNVYLTTMTDLVMNSGGVVDKIRGDSVMAFWGAPAEVPNPSRLAVDCALAMLEELKLLKNRDPRFADIDIGIGIATGEAVVGNFGGERRFDYSAIGDTVNLAARFEGLTRHFKAHLLVTRQTFAEANGPYVTRDVGFVKVKGKSEAVGMIEVLGRQDSGIDTGFCDRFAEALLLVRDGQARQACHNFEQLLKERPDDHVARMYLERLRSAADGTEREVVFEFDTK